MNSQEITQAADFAAELVQDGANPKCLVHVIYHPDSEQGLLGLSSPLAPNSSLCGLTERYYTLEELIRLELLHLKLEALDFYAETLALEGRAETLAWLNSSENHKVAEALVSLSWSYANLPVVAHCRKHRSQW